MIDNDRVRLAGLTMNAAYGGAGAVLAARPTAGTPPISPAPGGCSDSLTLNPDRGLFRLTVTSRGEVVLSDNLLRHPGGPPAQHGRVAFCQALLPRTRTLYVSVQDETTTRTAISRGSSSAASAAMTSARQWAALPAMATIVNTDGGDRPTTT